jgi:FkbM family methyltransferase
MHIDLSWLFSYLLKYKPKKSLNNLDDVIEKYLDKRNGSFIEVGANDGINQSNTYYLEVSKGWRGLLIEPIPRLYKNCKWNRPNATVENCALVSSDFEPNHVRIHDSNLMSLVQAGNELNNEESEHLKRGRVCQGLESTPVYEVKASTLSSLIDKLNKFQHVDLFSLDVEGFEPRSA